jgi:hypothetical protein
VTAEISGERLSSKTRSEKTGTKQYPLEAAMELRFVISKENMIV